jgi:hypothetical protein
MRQGCMQGFMLVAALVSTSGVLAAETDTAAITRLSEKRAQVHLRRAEKSEPDPVPQRDVRSHARLRLITLTVAGRNRGLASSQSL